MPKFGVYGPERHGRNWRVRTRSPDGAWSSCSFGSEEEAAEFAAALRSELDGSSAREHAAELRRQAEELIAEAARLEGRTVTVAEAIDRRELHQRERGRARATIATELYRLHAILDPVSEAPMAAVTERRAEELYRARANQETRPGRKVSPGTHRHELKAVRTLWAWAIDRGLASSNPWDAVEPIGALPRGKEQLTVEEARALHELLVAVLIGDDTADRDRALGAGLALYQGMRASEIVGLEVRRVTTDGRRIDVDKAKTRHGDRGLEVPEFLAAALADARARALDHGGAAGLVLPYERGWPRAQAHRFCDRAGVPRVCAHALRGMQSTLARRAGRTAEDVAAQLGHASTQVTRDHYTTPAAEFAATQRATLRVLQGGK